MARKKSQDQTDLAPGDILAGLAELVGQVIEAVAEAQALQASGRSREAMQHLAPVGDRLEDALALQRAAVILHGLR